MADTMQYVPESARKPLGPDARLPAIDFAADTVPSNEHFSTAYKFNPILRMHPDEKLYPIDIADYVDATPGRTWQASLKLPHLDPDIDFLFQRQRHRILTPTVHVVMRTIQSPREDLQPFLGWQLIYYIFLYSDQPDAKVCGCITARNTGHHADVEWVVALVDTSSRLRATYYSSHGTREASWLVYTPREVMNICHPRVYVSLDTHANYAQPGWKWRLWGVNIDKCSSRHQRKLCYGMRILDSTHPWLAYQGNMATQGIASLGAPNRLNLPSYEQVSQASQFRRRFFRCS